jgi:hypothetical protein
MSALGHFDQVIDLGLRADVRFDPDSDHDRPALQYVAISGLVHRSK